MMTMIKSQKAVTEDESERIWSIKRRVSTYEMTKQ